MGALAGKHPAAADCSTDESFRAESRSPQANIMPNISLETLARLEQSYLVENLPTKQALKTIADQV